MSTATAPLMTVDEFLALPDNGMDRELVEGQLRERPMTMRNRRHSRTTSYLVTFLVLWRDSLSPPRGEVLAGDAAFLLKRSPDTSVGLDVAYISADLANRTRDDVYLIDGVPVLAAEILSPSDTHEGTVDKIQLLLDSGVKVVWIIDPDLRTVTVYRPSTPPEFFNSSQELSGEPELPGFRVRVAELFAR